MGVLPDWMIEASEAIKPWLPCERREGVISYGSSSYGYDARVGYKFKVFTPVHCGEVDPKNFDEKSFVEVDLTPRGGHAFERNVTAESRCKHCDVAYSNPHKDSYLAECITKGIPNFVRIPPNSFALGETIEEFNIPRGCLAVVLGKSTYARCGIIVNVTPLEPEWRGKVTVEISNTTPLPARIYAGEGIMQVLMFQSAGYTVDMWKLLKSRYPASLSEMRPGCRVSYADKHGKYQDQAGLTLPKV